MSLLDVTVPGKPVPWARARRNGARYFTADAQEDWTGDAVMLMQSARTRNAAPGEPVNVEVVAVYPRNGKTPKRQAGRTMKTTRPDADNLGKQVCDALQRAGIVADDAQVVRLVVEKWHAAHGEAPGVRVVVVAP